MALFPYDAVKSDELTLVEGDIVTILSREVEDKGWWKGELKGKVGVFPDNFVQLLNQDEVIIFFFVNNCFQNYSMTIYIFMCICFCC